MPLHFPNRDLAAALALARSLLLGVGGGEVRVVREKEEEEVGAMTPRVRCKRRGWTTMDGQGLPMGGSCMSADIALRSSG